MKPRRTHRSNAVFKLEGGNEDNDLWVERRDDRLVSVWEPSREQREAIARGENIELHVFGQGTPPLAMRTTAVPLGRPPEAAE